MNTLATFEQSDDFIRRHIGPDQAEQQSMLGALGLDSLNTLIDETVPENIRSKEP
ncbi:MAG: hypothetical protein ACPGVP_03180, partial [Thiolinea sp.]